MANDVIRFYAWSRRKHSPERDLGLYWREGSSGPTYRAAWLEDTGELITVRHGPVNDGGGAVEVLGVFPDLEDVEEALEGWEDVNGDPGSVHWLRARARGGLTYRIPTM
jgi:hypothetical protein